MKKNPSDVIDYISKYAEANLSSSSSKRRAKSVPLPSKAANIMEPPIIVQGMYNGTPITVYGEVHNIVDNRFYEQLDLRNKVIFVEHATVLCDISMKDKKRLLNILKGTDWVWYKYKARNRPIVCVDNRVEIGLLSSIEEMGLMETDNFAAVIPLVITTLRVLITKQTKETFIKEGLTQYFESASKAIKSQMGVLLRAGHLASNDLMDTKWKLINNIMKLSAMLVDIHVKKQVEKYADGKKPIIIFMGAAHAYRLHTYFPQIFSNITYNTNDPILMENIETMLWT